MWLCMRTVLLVIWRHSAVAIVYYPISNLTRKEPKSSFLQDRSTAARLWKVSSVNEMLTWMENHPYSFSAVKEMLETEQKLRHNAYGNGIGFRAN